MKAIIALLAFLFLTSAWTLVPCAAASAVAKRSNDASGGPDTAVVQQQQLESIVSQAAVHNGIILSSEQLDRLVTALHDKLEQQEEPVYDADDDVSEQQRRELTFSSIFDIFNQIKKGDKSPGGSGLADFFDSIGEWFAQILPNLELLDKDEDDVPYVLPGTSSMCHRATCKSKKKKLPHRGRRTLLGTEQQHTTSDTARVRQRRDSGTTPVKKNPLLLRRLASTAHSTSN